MNRDNVYLTEEELVVLIEESTGDRYLQVGWGSAQLFNDSCNDWAFKRVEEMRKI